MTRLLSLGLAAALFSLAGCGRVGSPAGTPAPAGPPARALTAVALYAGGEKMELIANPRFQALLAERHGLKLDAAKAGSVEMVRDLDPTGKDAIWPSNDIAVELFRMRGGKIHRVDIVFNSPLVIYTGWNIAGALIREGLIERRGDIYYLDRLADLLQMIQQERTWKDLGLDFYGNLTVRTSDPTRSNSGNMFAGLVANLFNGGRVADEAALERHLPEIRAFFGRLGMMEHSSGDVFSKFIATGIQNSLVVGYENQLVEFILAHPQYRDQISKSVCVIYPRPTVWSSHPVIALNDKGARLIDALADPEIRALAWREHGFRSGLMGVTQSAADLGLDGLPDTIDSVMPLPNARAMERLVKELSTL